LNPPLIHYHNSTKHIPVKSLAKQSKTLIEALGNLALGLRLAPLNECDDVGCHILLSKNSTGGYPRQP